MSATVGTSTPTYAWGAEPSGSAYLWAYRGVSLRVEALDRATAGPEIRFVLSDGSAVSMRVVGGLTNLTATPAGNVLTIGPVTITLSEVAGGHTHLRYDLRASVKPANNQVAWTVTATGGASTALLGDGSLSLRNATGVEEAAQVPPTATDRNGTAVAVTATLSNGVLTYTIANIANNRYPLVIDPTTVSTSTNANATARSQRRLVHVASSGVAIALYYDGSNWQWRTASSPYSSWSSATAVTNATREAGLTACMASNDDVHVMYRTTSGPDIAYRRLTYSAGSWSLGSEVSIATGDYGGGGEYFSSAVDVDGRIWLYTMRWIGSSSAEIFYSATGASWTNSLTPTGNGNFPGGAVIARAGDYIVALRMDGGSINWRRVATNGSVGAWSSESTKTSVGLYNDHQFVALSDGNDRLMVAGVPLGTDWAIRTISYIPGTDTWDTTYTDIGTGTSDRNPALAKVGSDLYCVWSEYASASSYAIVYKKWDASGASWGSRVEMVASGANRLYVNAGGNSTMLAAVWTAGTGSPYDVVFEYVQFGAERSVAGDLPAASGALSRTLAALRTLAGAMPTATGALEYSVGLISRSLAGAMPTATGALTRTYQALRALAGNQPTSSGTLTRTAGAFARSLAGSMPAASGVLDAAFDLITRSLAGSMPAATGAVTRTLAALRAATGDLPAASGALSRTAAAFARAVAGSPAAATGAVSRIKQAVRTLTGSMPTATGVLQSAFGVINRALSGTMDAPSGAVSRRLAALRTLEGIQPTATGILARTAGAFARVLDGVMGAVSGLLTRTHSSETTAVSATAADALYGAAVAADSLYVAATAADTALVGATASDSEG